MSKQDNTLHGVPAGAIMDGLRALRNDALMQRMKPCSPERIARMRNLLSGIAAEHGIETESLGLAIAQAMEHA